VAYPELEDEEFFQAILLFPLGSFDPNDDPTHVSLREDMMKMTPLLIHKMMMRRCR